MWNTFGKDMLTVRKAIEDEFDTIMNIYRIAQDFMIKPDLMGDMFGSKGVLYNVHYPRNPEDVKEKGCDYAAALRKVNQFF